MTVAELIAKLQQMPPAMRVVVDGSHDTTFVATEVKIQRFEPHFDHYPSQMRYMMESESRAENQEHCVYIT